MQIPLSRIEYSYVFETFLQELPPLLLQSGALFYMLPSGAYTIKNSRLYFQSLPEFIGKKIAVFFDHKKRSIVFYTAIYADDGSCLLYPIAHINTIPMNSKRTMFLRKFIYRRILQSLHRNTSISRSIRLSIPICISRLLQIFCRQPIRQPHNLRRKNR